MNPKLKPYREFIENGIRMVQLEKDGEPFVVQDDFAKFIAQLPNEKIQDPAKRSEHAEFVRSFPTLPPAIAYRAAVAILGEAIPEDFRTMRPRRVKEGAA